MNLKMLTGNKELYDVFLEELDDRIESARKRLEVSLDPTEMYRCQGEIRVLNRLKRLKETLKGREITHGR